MNTPVSGVEIHGHCDPRFQPLADAFAANFEDGLELGASLAVVHGEDTVVDLWAGWEDPERTAPWREDSITCVYSTSKVACALCTLMLVDRGLLDLDSPVARYWPEFAANGKADISVRWILTHQSGVAGWDEVIDWEDLYDWDSTVARLAAQAPWWEPGAATGYHMLTFGFLLGELVRRITGQSLGEFLRTEVCEPIDADFWIGLPESEHGRIVTQHQEVLRAMEDFSAGPLWTRVQASPQGSPDYVCTASRVAEIPSANGHGNARAIARMGAILANRGSYAGHRALSPGIIDAALVEQCYRTDLVIDEPVRLGLGFGLSSKEFQCPSARTLHWGGYGGSICMMDVEHGIAFGYAMNELYPELNDDPRDNRLRPALRECVDAL